VNQAKSAVARPEERHFVGFSLRRTPEDGTVEVFLSKRSKSRIDARIRELTPRSISLGIALALILGAANAYLGLYAGLTVSASIPAAVISMAILRILGGSTILENNVVQTIASAGEAVAAGAIFTFPALVILGGVKTLPYVEVTALCVVGATMGALLVVFLRRAYIVEERLPFPEGVACAQVLRAGDAQANVRPLVVGGLISAALKALQDVAGVIPGAVSGARWVGSIGVLNDSRCTARRTRQRLRSGTRFDTGRSHVRRATLACHHRAHATGCRAELSDPRCSLRHRFDQVCDARSARAHEESAEPPCC